jgi:hypothetical protein
VRRSGTPGVSGRTGGGAIGRLDLGLLIDAEHDCRVERAQVEADDVADLVDELRVGVTAPGFVDADGLEAHEQHRRGASVDRRRCSHASAEPRTLLTTVGG